MDSTTAGTALACAPGRRRIWICLAVLLLGASLPVVPASRTPPARASISINQGKGFDTCNTSIENLQAFWSNTPYYNVGIYLGGASYGCTDVPDASYMNQVVAMGWHVMSLWVGPQAPCSGFQVTMSWDATVAYSQGVAEAKSVYDRMVALQMDTVDTPVTYDLEGFDTTDSACLAAARSFIQGWTDQLHVPTAQRSGVYGSTCGSAVAGYAADFIYGAQWDDNPNTGDMSSCVPDDWWTAHQRHKQYAGNVLETWNGVTLNLDRDCSDGPVYPTGDVLDPGQGCV
jgi:Rv2525c-like, glycoside hydrolase-like domain